MIILLAGIAADSARGCAYPSPAGLPIPGCHTSLECRDGECQRRIMANEPPVYGDGACPA